MVSMKSDRLDAKDGDIANNDYDNARSREAKEAACEGTPSNTSKQDLLMNSSIPSIETTPPPLPPRRNDTTQTPSRRKYSPTGSIRIPKSGDSVRSLRPALHTRPTTALSVNDIHSTRVVSSSHTASPTPRQFSFAGFGFGGGNNGKGKSDVDDNASVVSYAPSLVGGGHADIESMLGDALQLPVVKTPRIEDKALGRDNHPFFVIEPLFEEAFESEFHALDDITSDGLNEEAVMAQWKSKLKHFMILSSAGKPIWSRHGNDQIITSYIGMIQTLIAFYEGADDELRSFTAGTSRFIVLTRGSLHLVAISKLDESEQQLRGQLEALYMQILSTLTLPVMERMFKARASTDLRRPLEGTEKLLSALADGFTRGSPSTLLSSLECLRLRKAHRAIINNAFLKVKTDNLLYGLIVAGGRLVSVVRPRKQSLHPGDLQLIFNMLFEARGVQASDSEENWIPLCLPGFNNTGYVYMHVSFFDLSATSAQQTPSTTARPDGTSPQEEADDPEKTETQVAILLISTKKDAFAEFHNMRSNLVSQLHKTGGTSLMHTAITRSRPQIQQIVPSSPLIHFLYKSKGNVQFFMPSYPPSFPSAFARRQLMSIYARLQTVLHSKTTYPKIFYAASGSCSCIAWGTPVFELYAIAKIGVERSVLAEAANRVVQFVRKEEERIFIIGGAVF